MAFEKEWIVKVRRARQKVLTSNRDPIQLLVALFELYQGEFDITSLNNRLPTLYEQLEKFCLNVPQSTVEAKENCTDLIKCFYDHQTEIQMHDIELYYALLNLNDWLKVNLIKII